MYEPFGDVITTNYGKYTHIDEFLGLESILKSFGGVTTNG